METSSQPRASDRAIICAIILPHPNTPNPNIVQPLFEQPVPILVSRELPTSFCHCSMQAIALGFLLSPSSCLASLHAPQPTPTPPLHRTLSYCCGHKQVQVQRRRMRKSNQPQTPTLVADEPFQSSWRIGETATNSRPPTRMPSAALTGWRWSRPMSLSPTILTFVL